MRGTTDWWDATWNPVGGCSPASAGCANCYASAQTGTLHQQRRPAVPLYTGIVDRTKAGYVFNGNLTALKPGHQGWVWPLRWPGAAQPMLGAGQPSLIFVADMADLFHEGRPTAVIDRTVATIAASDHIGQLLTKRSARMLEYFETERPPRTLRRWQQKVWLGFSAERQQEFDERWPDVRALAAQGWTIYASIAPMLGPVRLPPDFLVLGDRAWAICSGEQGRRPHAPPRDLKPNWARAVRDQCAAAGVAFFMKQMAGRKPIPPDLQVRQFPAQRM